MKNLALVIIIISILQLGCETPRYASRITSPAWGGDSGAGNYDFDSFRGNQFQKAEIARSITGLTDESFDKSMDRVVLYDATLTLVVKDADSVYSKLFEIAEKYDGYLLTSGTHKSVIRVKSQMLEKAIDEIALLGKLKTRTISGRDVTDEYRNYEIRLENAKKARKRYLELLEKAENVEAALKVEKELERLNGEIDSMMGRLKRLSHLSEYSTITVYLHKKVKYGVLGYISVGLYYGVKWLFVRN